MKVSLVIPVYNEQYELAEVLAKYITDLKHICSVYKELGVSYEVVIVNDGSDDSSVRILTESARLNRNIRVVNFDGRYGKQAAITAGMEVAIGDVVMLADIDVLNPIGILKRVFDEYVNGESIVYAYRERTGFDKFVNNTSERFTNMAATLFGVGGTYTGRPRISLFSRNVVDVIVSLPAKNKVIRAMDNWLGWSVQPIEYSSGYNKAEEREKNIQMKRRFDKRGGDVVQRSKIREHSAALTYARTVMVVAVMFFALAVVLASSLDLRFMFHFFLWLLVIMLCLVAVILYARAVLIKRVGIIHNRETQEIFNIHSVIN
jgi:dolichol-phosphate mannosyltransferase